MSDIAVKATGSRVQRPTCRRDSAIFFPAQGDPATQARRICASCPLRAGFLQHATAADEWGIWGGLDRKQRRVIADKSANSPTLNRPSA